MISKDKLDELVKQFKNRTAPSKEEYIESLNIALSSTNTNILTITTPTISSLSSAIKATGNTRYQSNYPKLEKQIKSQLLTDLKKGKKGSKVYKYICDIAGNKIFETPDYVANADDKDYDKLLDYLEYSEPKTIEHTYTQAEIDKLNSSTTKQVELEPITKGGKPIDPPKAGETVRVTLDGSYKASDLKGLIEFMSTLPVVYTYQLFIANNKYGDFGVLAWVDSLINELGIEGKTARTKYQRHEHTTLKAELVISMELRITKELLTLALSQLIKPSEGMGGVAEYKRVRVNIKDGHDALPRPATTPLTELFAAAILSQASQMLKMFNDYRTPEALQEAGGFKLLVTQRQLSFFTPSDDPAIMQEMVRANVPILIKVLITILNEAQRTGGLNTEPRFTKIADLAEPMYRPQIEKRGKLDTKNKEAYFNNMQFLDSLQFYYYEKPSKHNKGGGIYKKFKIIEITRIETNKKGIPTHVEWHLSEDFINLLPYLVFVNTDGILELQNPNTQMLAIYINDQLVKSEPQTNKTIKGEPIEIDAKTLADKAGFSKGNTTRRYSKYLPDSLNELEQKGIIGKWYTQYGDQDIRSRGGKLPKISIYPSENVRDSYISPSLDKSQKQAHRQEQTRRRLELEKLDANYRNDFKDSKDATEYRSYLAEDLGTTLQELSLMLLKPTKGIKPVDISDDMLAKIRELAKDYKG